MKEKIERVILYLVISIILPVCIVGCRKTDANTAEKELIIFHAGSLSVPFRQVSELFKEQYPDVVIKAEASGSRSAARKICDLNRRCDVFGSADYRVVEDLLMPDYVSFNLRFALNEMVIAYTNKSRLAGNITSDNWFEILMKDKVAFGRSNPDLDPCGYRSLMVFQLAEKYYKVPRLSEKLTSKDRYIRPKETDLLALLEAGEIDYLFIYRSIAVQHKLNMIMLPDEINLKSPAFADLYRTAAVKLSGKKPGTFITRSGEPMVYSVTIPDNAPNPEAAEAWVRLLFSPKGRKIMEDNGQPFLVPAKADGSGMPHSLESFCERQK